MLAQVLAALVQHRGLPEVLNLAQPGPVAMGDLLRAAGLDFSLRPAPDSAIPEVALEYFIGCSCCSFRFDWCFFKQVF